ncbi:hypothetical protein FPOAC2_05055 [Fusarium poae]|jgi:hypothetical protein
MLFIVTKSFSRLPSFHGPLRADQTLLLPVIFAYSRNQIVGPKAQWYANAHCSFLICIDIFHVSEFMDRRNIGNFFPGVLSPYSALTMSDGEERDMSANLHTKKQACVFSWCSCPIND